MTENELVKMSPKGQLVVPQEIRETASFKAGDRFVPFPVKNGVLFKKIEIPDLNAEFGKLSKEVEAQFKKRKVTGKDVSGAVKWARKG
ncbi:AbrB/MazE/SpoVT family DNA-binding domain-containing protein [Candidatus Woesearchaeota archaeon]|nr:AbrB/MazE/SpoVT family DNA-binding domain-containing protein [Candidatus Woesearchaeota archaeon]